jgi:hypothetical protein
MTMRTVRILAVLIAALTTSAAVAISESGAARETALKFPGLGWIVTEDGAPAADVAAAKRSAASGEWLTGDAARKRDENISATDPDPDSISLEPFKTEGPRRGIAQVKAAAPRLVNRDLGVQQAGVRPSQFRRLLARIYTRGALREQLELNLEAARQQAAGELPATSFDAHRVIVDKWLGVRVREQQAVALFRGRQKLRWAGDWDTRRYTWRLTLRREGGRWLLSRMIFEDLGRVE